LDRSTSFENRKEPRTGVVKAWADTIDMIIASMLGDARAASGRAAAPS
jgi:hypothetical protein